MLEATCIASIAASVNTFDQMMEIKHYHIFSEVVTQDVLTPMPYDSDTHIKSSNITDVYEESTYKNIF